MDVLMSAPSRRMDLDNLIIVVLLKVDFMFAVRCRNAARNTNYFPTNYCNYQVALFSGLAVDGVMKLISAMGYLLLPKVARMDLVLKGTQSFMPEVVA